MAKKEAAKESIITRWRNELWHHKYLIGLSLLFFITAAILNVAAGNYVDKINDAAATSDLILNKIPVIDLSYIFIYGFVAVIFLIFLYPLFFKINELHIVISQFSLLVLVRSIFVTLTHLKMPLDAIVPHFPSFLSFFAFNNDLFFSGHTAICFLGFLLFKEEKIGKFFLVSTFILAATVLLMHLHYSIDVFAAFFITYATFKFGQWFFRKVNQYRQMRN